MLGVSSKRYTCRKKSKKEGKKRFVKVSPLLFCYALIFLAMGKGYEGLSYLVCVILHECAHAREAAKRGYELECIRLTVFGAALSGRFESIKAEDERAIAAAGPLLNLALALSCAAVWWLFPSTYFFTMDFAYANVGLLLFNLLPVYPLDGGRLLVAWLSKRINRENAYKRVRVFGFFFGGVLVALFAVSLFFAPNPSFLLVGIFTLISSFFPDPTCRYHRLYRLSYRAERIRAGLELKEVAVFSSMTVRQAQRLLNAEYFTCFVLLDDSLNPRRILPETAIEEAHAYPDDTLFDVANRLDASSPSP